MANEGFVIVLFIVASVALGNGTGRCVTAAALSGMFALKERLADLAHEFILFSGSREYYLLVGNSFFGINFRNGQLQAVTFVLAEGIAAACRQPFRNHFDILEGGNLIIVLVNFSSHGSGLFFAGNGTDNGKLSICFFCYKTGNDVEHDKTFLSP